MKFINIKEKILGLSGSLSGSLSFLGGYQVCHNACLALVSFLTFLGFAVAGMPLLFLTKVAIPFWTAALTLLAITTFLKYRNKMKISIINKFGSEESRSKSYEMKTNIITNLQLTLLIRHNIN